ncbi:MAG: mechanosensitive ion channel family protein [Spirulinaceae cyanobacterium RM2_2_10]|nr:mechanosensitive ion channel family protein [Spirulinaceae cyanobacterium SM2_1_0]NJO20913.1 mechanosensitive ion channel family protein [Spirulinaceae cyanobacterium RM2_2_10]
MPIELQQALEMLTGDLQDAGVPDYLIFLGFALVAIAIGNLMPVILRFIAHRFLPKRGQMLYETLAAPIGGAIKAAATLILLNSSWVWLRSYAALYDLTRPWMNLAVTISVAWLLSRLFQQLVRGYGIKTLQKMGLEADELILPFEAVVNVAIGIFAALAFAQSQNINLFGLIASLGVAATAVGLAAQSALSQIIGTIVLYLDRPFVKGDYIRLPSGLYGRVESIGLRSTKIRTVAKSTLAIVPNSQMAEAEIENITRGKKVMVLLYLDFNCLLAAEEQAMVQQVIKSCTDAINGIDPGSTRIQLLVPADRQLSRARVTFFILGSSENSIQLRKRLLEIANDNISKQLRAYDLEFTTQEPTIYIESPVTI